MVQIRKASKENVADLVPLVTQYWQFEGICGFDRISVADQLERLLSDPKLGGGWLAVTKQGPVGYLLAVYVFSLEHLGLTAEIDELFVLPSQRGQGIGIELLKTAENEFVRVGCTNASLQLSQTNDAARALYHREGYTDRSQFEILEKPLRH